MLKGGSAAQTSVVVSRISRNRPSFTTTALCTLPGDFFTYRDPGGLFDYGFDYTFL